jgi:uncharacterized protein
LIGAAVVVALTAALAWTQLPVYGAAALLHPARRIGAQQTPGNCEDVTFRGNAVSLRGWRCRGQGPIRGTVVFLHGVADTRASAVGIIRRFSERGFDSIAYDSRAHGESSGEICTYGFFEKLDLHRVLDTVAAGPIIVIGHSLGAAVALQAAERDSRITTIVAAETFSDLRTVATERAPVFFTPGVIERAFALAERQGTFDVDAVSPVRAAASIRIPVLVIHGAADADTLPSHSQRVFDALAGPKRLIVVSGAHHNETLGGAVWNEIDRWINDVLTHQIAEDR